ncbi:hypothetical protein BpHYR1_051017 [Brachionus plicatilis]|uniref:Uncharacterized protein n=1 Tax=Brachionus plicatilis TaxID=10195 RepID=A0A3M7SQZ8_BRAPC|nr:hypothetical protein BpHYR1_051017 [Brachionus plicatilis]
MELRHGLATVMIMQNSTEIAAASGSQESGLDKCKALLESAVGTAGEHSEEMDIIGSMKIMHQALSALSRKRLGIIPFLNECRDNILSWWSIEHRLIEAYKLNSLNKSIFPYKEDKCYYLQADWQNFHKMMSGLFSLIRAYKKQSLVQLQTSEFKASKTIPKGIKSDDESDEIGEASASRRKRFDQDDKFCQKCGVKIVKIRQSSCPNK